MQLNSLWQSQLSTSCQLLCRQVVGLSDDPFFAHSQDQLLHWKYESYMNHTWITWNIHAFVLHFWHLWFNDLCQCLKRNFLRTTYIHRNHEHHEQSPCTAYRYRNWKLKSQATATSPRFAGQALNFDCFQAFWIPFGELIGWCRHTGATGSVKIDVKSQHILGIFCAAVEDCFL